MNLLKKHWSNVAAIVLFLVLSFVYMWPITQGKKLSAGDVMAASAMQNEINEYKKDGTAPLWTNNMFGGMPSYQIWIQYPNNIASHFFEYWNKMLPFPITIVMLYFIGGYVLFRLLRYKYWLSFIGAIAIAFVSYNFIIIEAGHTGKAFAIAFFPPIIGAIIIAYKGERLKAAAIMALFLALEIRANHLQMTYYLMIMALLMGLSELIYAIRNKTVADFAKSTLALLAGTIVAVGVNAGTLMLNSEYANESIRGKSDIVVPQSEGKGSGLDKSYAYQWSEGVGETITLLIPDAYGGASGIPFDTDSDVYSVLTQNGVPADQAKDFSMQLGAASRYWGDKPFTSGPYYMGAVTIFLFIVSLAFIKGPIKWGLASTVVLTILLSWGRNFQWFSDLFFDYFPLYSKFRAVESILAVTGVAIPILAVMALHQILENKNIQKEEVLKKINNTFYSLSGFLVVFIALPSLFLSFSSPSDLELLQQLKSMVGSAFGQDILTAIVSERTSIARTDAIRTLVFVSLTYAVLWAHINNKIKVTVAASLFLALFIADNWTIAKRYLKDDNFVEARRLKQNNQNPRAVDLQIKKDKDPYYRVFDMTDNAFSSPKAAKFHKTIGGYHAAKLKRFQNLIDSQLVKGNPWVFNMLNVKYFITTDESGREIVVPNDQALGNAWFVTSVKFMDNANQELMALDSTDPKNTAIIGQDFRNSIDMKKLAQNIVNADSVKATIKLTSYHPDTLRYEFNSSSSQIIVFSDIYYDKGWNAYVDGKEYPYFRTNFVLRGMQIDAGKHNIEFRFEPSAFYLGEKISLVSSILLIAGLIAAFWFNKKEENI